MERRNLARLTAPQLVAEIRRAREDLEETARYMGEVTMVLHAQTRRPDFRDAARRTATLPAGIPREVSSRLQQEAVDEVSSTYTLYANTWHRFAGMILQGVRRTVSSERIMRRLEGKHEVSSGASSEPSPTPLKSTKASETESSMKDLVELYGVETVKHAQR